MGLVDTGQQLDVLLKQNLERVYCFAPLALVLLYSQPGTRGTGESWLVHMQPLSITLYVIPAPDAQLSIIAGAAPSSLILLPFRIVLKTADSKTSTKFLCMFVA